MGGMPPHDKRKSADAGRPQDIGIRGRLAATLQNSLMDGPKFVEMIALIGTAAGIHE